MDCRSGCAACCVVISISSCIPGYPEGKPADVVCCNLDHATLKCTIWNMDNYPDVCRYFMPDPAYCGKNADEAYKILAELEKKTFPD